MSAEQPLAEALDRWTKQGGDLDELLPPAREQSVKTADEARAICAALDAIRAEPARAGKKFSSPRHTLTGLFQQVESKDAYDALTQNGLPRLRFWVRERLDGRDVAEDDVMFILKVLAMYRQREDVELIAQAARKPVAPDGYLWSVIFSQFDGEHPHSAAMVEALRNPLPGGFILVTYADMANTLAVAGKLGRHPFDTEPGRKRLEIWLRDKNEEKFSYAHTATTALPFIEPRSQAELFQAAFAHPDAGVRMEAAWAQAKSGDPAGLDRLSSYCLDPLQSYVAQQYLEELGRPEKIPEKAREAGFRAVAEMAHWLAHPGEFGRSPDSIELFDSRELFWPPTNDKRTLYIVKFAYNGKEGGKADRGVGLVGSVTFALFGETTADLTPEDIYALHCCWELETNEDSRAPAKRTAAAGREILRRQNDGF